jgi:hypothetical protein
MGDIPDGGSSGFSILKFAPFDFRPVDAIFNLFPRGVNPQVVGLDGQNRRLLPIGQSLQIGSDFIPNPADQEQVIIGFRPPANGIEQMQG